jgi:hypothetical protein
MAATIARNHELLARIVVERELAPPGYYMLFVLKPGDRAGIEYPSEAKMIRLAAP